MAREISSATSSLVPPERARSSASANSTWGSFGFLDNTASKRLRASSGFFSARSSAARLATDGKYAGSSATERSKLFRAPAKSCLAKSTRPRKLAANGLSGCFFSKEPIACKALSNSLRRILALIKAISAVVPLSNAAMSCNSLRAESSLPAARWVKASAVRALVFLGSCLVAFEKNSSAFLVSPFCR